MPIYSTDGPEGQGNLRRAGEALRRGELVAFPTETVYGLGANALDDTAVARIFAAKGRPSYNPLIVHVADAMAAKKLVASWPPEAVRLAKTFWPGPLSLVLPRQGIVAARVSAGLSTVAVRVPAHPVAQALLRAAAVPLAAPSANRFTELSPTRAAHVENALGDRVTMILDGGACDVGIESTVVDLSGNTPVLLRAGTISKAELEAVIGPIREAPPIDANAPRASPGMVPRHYAPRARLHCFQDIVEVTATAKSGAVLRSAALAVRFAEVLVLPDEALGFARGLYNALHTLDAVGCTDIWVQDVPDNAEWRGIRDRLARASHD